MTGHPQSCRALRRRRSRVAARAPNEYLSGKPGVMEAVKTLGYGAVKARGLRLSGQGVLEDDSAPLLSATHMVDQGRLVVSPWGHYAGVVVPLQGSQQDMVGLPKTSNRQQLRKVVVSNPVRDDGRQREAGPGLLTPGCRWAVAYMSKQQGSWERSNLDSHSSRTGTGICRRMCNWRTMEYASGVPPLLDSHSSRW